MAETDTPDDMKRDQELIDRFTASPPARRKMSAGEVAYVTKHIRDNSQTTISQATGLERFEAKASLLPDGRLLIVAKGKSSPSRRHLPIVRGSTYGAYLKLLVSSKGEPRLAILIASSPEFQALRKSRSVFAYVRMGKVEEVIEFDYSMTEHSEIINQMLDDTDECDRDIKSDLQWIDDDVMLRAEAIADTAIDEYFTREDWLQVGWVRECYTRYKYLINDIAALSGEPKMALEDEELKKHPRLVRMMEILSGAEPAGTRMIKLVRYLADPEVAVEGFLDIYCYVNVYGDRQPAQSMGLLLSAWQHVVLLPEISDWGRRQYSFSGFDKKVFTWEIDVSKFPIMKNEEAKEYWTNQPPTIAFDGDQYLDPGDMPANIKALHDIWKLNPPDIDPEEADEIALGLLEEASALRQWTIPPRACVELAFGPFVAAELTELGDEVYFVWRTEDNRYWRNSVGVAKKGFDNLAYFTDDKRVAVTMKLVMCALVRDFLVAEERRKIFDVKKKRIGEGKHSKQQTRFVYLPRIRYIIDNNAPKRLKEGLEQGVRSRHLVRSFFRKVEKPSAIQLAVARAERITVPEGHTFVRAHYRGGREAQRIYRSRSALQLLYEAINRPEINPEQDDWFEFERMTAELLEKHLGFTVLSRAAKGGDGGIDILASKEAGGLLEIWVVQCKCYSANNPIGPDKIRELVGTMVGVKKDERQVVRGMFVTSSRYTPEAIRTAVQHGVQTIDHAQLVDICASVNRSVHQMRH